MSCVYICMVGHGAMLAVCFSLIGYLDQLCNVIHRFLHRGGAVPLWRREEAVPPTRLPTAVRATRRSWLCLWLQQEV